ncbi:MAGE family-domain-containing protein [Coprinopsis sp. MPI-PUGE-AT-0042]|nr:MAGE family-domain-containing protein [Coprinopsis sp. MPI-PUGE-AT-0042]KAH6905228.1 MAGE family-domain-containing protein [Coprinopsis sp. MPI-PUGE-AT-0042]
MAPRAGTRSQRPSGTQAPPQTQHGRNQRAGKSQRAGPSQTQRDSDEEEEEEEEAQQSQAMDVDQQDEEVTRRANDLVRLALFTEQKRAHLRRDEINKKVLAPHNKLFNKVFAAAQKILRDTFGMEMVELPSRAWLENGEADTVPAATQGGSGRGGATQAQDSGLNEARRATGVKKKATAAGSKTYILRSCLNTSLIEMAHEPDNKILAEEKKDLPEEEAAGYARGNEDQPPTTYGSIISWSHTEQIGSIGILYTILALILVNGRVLSDGELRSYLKNLHLPNTATGAPVTFTTASPIHGLSTEAFLNQLIKQNYLERRATGDTGRTGGGKRGRATQTQRRDDDDGAREMYEWRWGTRAMCEVGEEAIARFVTEFMVEGSDGDEEAQNTQKKKDQYKKMYSGIEKAAGGKLSDVK